MNDDVMDTTCRENQTVFPYGINLHMEYALYEFLEGLGGTDQDNLNPEIGASIARLPAPNVNELGIGLRDDYFLNVIIRSLWNLREFREELMSRSEACHKHIHEYDCIFCSLEVLFSAISKDKEVEAADLNYLKTALITHTRLLKKERMRDAYDCVRVILESLHDSIISILKPEDRYDCFIADCFVHRIFGWDHHERIYCDDCHLESGHRKTTSLFLLPSVRYLRTMKEKDAYKESSFDELLKLVGMNQKMECNQCRNFKYICHTIRRLPPVFTIVLDWPKEYQSWQNIARTFNALSAELNLSVIFQGHHPDSQYFLISLVCFECGERDDYFCFNYNQVLKKYVMYNGRITRVTGSWEDVVNVCITWPLRPLILFFNQKSRMKFGHLQSRRDRGDIKGGPGMYG